MFLIKMRFYRFTIRDRLSFKGGVLGTEEVRVIVYIGLVFSRILVFIGIWRIVRFIVI